MDRRAILSAGAAVLVNAANACAADPQADPLPLPENALRKIGFCSCIDQTKPQPVWDAIWADKPELFIFGGDNVYSAALPWQLASLQNAYSQLDASPGFSRMRRNVPSLAIWDDNDYGMNDGGVEFAHKQASKDAFLEFWRVPGNDPRRGREGLYHAVKIGPADRQAQIILLDGRWFRSSLRRTDQRNAPGKERYLPDPDPAKTMLGETQWRWLQDQLEQPADLRLIVSGVQIIAQGHGWESWGNLPRERSRLVDLIGRTRANGVVLLSGDRHIGALYRHERQGSYALTEMTSSGMTHAWAEASEAGPNRLGDLVTQNHYATVELDWLSRRVVLSIKDVQGQVRRQQVIALSDLA